jgi:competence protein ComEA
MAEQNKSMLVVYAAAVLAVALIGARYLKSVAAAPAGGPPIAASSSFGGAQHASATSGGVTGGGAVSKFHALIVDVSGAVKRPGLVRLRDGDRVGDAVKAAGGPVRGADLDTVNLAAQLADGQQVLVPSRSNSGGSGASGTTGPISLGAATAEQLDALDGIGPGLAAKIVAYRNEHGGFRSVDQLGDVPGIGDKRLDSLRSQLQP